jgi:hypothetical protein
MFFRNVWLTPNYEALQRRRIQQIFANFRCEYAREREKPKKETEGIKIKEVLGRTNRLLSLKRHGPH